MRIKQMQQEMRKSGIGACAFFNTGLAKKDAMVQYLADLDPEYGLVVVKQQGSYVALTKMERLRYDGKLRLKNLKTDFYKEFPRVKKLGLNFSMVSMKEKAHLKKHVKSRLVDATDMVNSLRAVKTQEELVRIKKACAIGDKIYQGLFSRKYRTEAEVKARIISETYANGCTPSFEPIVASGRNSALPHYAESSKLRQGPVIIDFGVRHKGYCSDMTRTAYVGRITKKVKEAHSKVLQVLDDSITMAKPGVEVSLMAKHAKKQLGKRLLHNLGHGIGLEVHELPKFTENNEARLEKGNVVAIEPGYYTKDFGIRIEDDVVVGGKVLTRAPREMVHLNRK
ncbi:MAG: Xaa-Pro peptidase family protein [Nanoarchaeota archaeon]|nr:Xaa-Pro peptidase family protein [Nanoarchaeota archaeon]